MRRFEKKMVIALRTDDFELAETDISDLEIGDSETIYTDSGRTIDLLRTEDGVEIYVDGELIDLSHHGAKSLHGGHNLVHKRMVLDCDLEEDCEDLAWISEDGEIDVESLHGEDHHEKVIVIKKKVELD